MDAAGRTKELDRRLAGVARWYAVLVFAGWYPFVDIVAASLLAYRLWQCADVSTREAAIPIRAAAVALCPVPVLATASLFVGRTADLIGLPLMGVALYAGVHGFAMAADWFGGRDRWSRARHEAAAVAGALCLLAGLALATPDMTDSNRITFGAGDPAAVQVAAVVAAVVMTYGVWRISLAFRDLRMRVRAAVAANGTALDAAAVTTGGEPASL